MHIEYPLILLLLAAVLEVVGDALIRMGLHAAQPRRAGFYALGAFVLFSYGYLVNSPPWDFGRLLDVYIVLFFVVSQAAAWFVFGQKPGIALLLGGALIISGGIVISWDAIRRGYGS